MLSQRRRVRKGLKSSPILPVSEQTSPKSETAPAPDNGPPARLDNSQQPTFVDPQAAICWSANLQPQIKSTFKMGSLIGPGSGESFQLAFHGPGFVVVQPSEREPVVASS
ncbi:AIM24 family protein [uncultured Actinomyces sp.]|uniref:AIM24 family protein n=1 Tax=uncultured Actinomyces sp. TaxID=249061 RepID=UPI0028D57A26|nr:AIM24 family protein [uncultured Actinomyces sp.]